MSERIICAVLTLLLSTSCQSIMKEKALPENKFPDGVAYEIFIQSFADNNKDGIGDIPGATHKLDYLKDLGVKAVWLMPVMPSPSYHKYDVTDYKAIHPDYGTMEDFKEFVAEAHTRGIKVIIDMIINHTSSEHPWFQSARTGPESPYREYYVWADKDSVADQIAKKEVTQDSDNIRQWHAVNDNEAAEHYYGFFYGGMPDLNFDSEKVRAEIIEIGRFWLEEVNVDGFRLDAAKHIFPDERIKDSYEWWQYYSDEMRKVKPDVYLIGEVWAASDVVKEFAKGLPALFNFDLAGSVQQSVIQGNDVAATIDGPEWSNLENQSLVTRLIEQRKVFKSANPNYQDAIFLSNHDQNRIMSNLNGNAAKAKLAASILLTLPGTPYIYYGEEIGMLGKKPDEHIREPFLWDEQKKDSSRTRWIKPKFSSDKTVTPLSLQKEAGNSLYNHYKALIALRNENQTLAKGEIAELVLNNPFLLTFQRIYEGDTLKVVHNLSGEPQQFQLNYADVVYGKEYLKLISDVLQIDSRTSVILR